MIQEVDEDFGPIDFIVVEFPVGSTDFDPEFAREVLSHVDSEMIRILDVLILDKDDDGQTEAFEVEELGDRASLRVLDRQLADIISAEDIPLLATAMEPGTMAGVLVLENRWASPLAAAVRRCGAAFTASGRIPHQVVIEALRPIGPEV